MKLGAGFLLSIFLLLGAGPTLAQVQLVERQFADHAALLSALRAGGYVLYWRHAATDHSQTDKTEVDFADCATQRNLSAQGREQATAIGKAMVALAVGVDRIYSSPYCRCVDSAELAFGRLEVIADLEFSIALDEATTERFAKTLRSMLATPAKAGKNTVIVSHSGNLLEAVGIWPKPEGVMEIFYPLDDGRVAHYGRLLAEDWARLLAGAKGSR